MTKDPIEIKEVVQAGDVFLVRYKCPICFQEIIADFKQMDCDRCCIDFTDIPVIAPKTKLRCLAGTRRKTRGEIGIKAIRLMVQQQDGLCAYCAQTLFDNYHVEHIVPLSFGGTNNLSNLCISCAPCNHSAGALVFQDFYQKRDYILGARFKKNFRRQ